MCSGLRGMFFPRKLRRVPTMLLMGAISAIIAPGQPVDPVPLPIRNPRVIEPGVPVRALSPEGKAELALRNTFGIRGIANRALLAGLDHAFDNPSEWPGGGQGYGMRFGSRMGRLAISNSIRLGADVAFRLEPRYDRCECKGFGSRTKHALLRVIVARTDEGGRFPAVSNFADAFISPAIYDIWGPDYRSPIEGGVGRAGIRLGWRGATNMVREFWPEIRRVFPFKP
jgi:hypothetical protein